MSSVESPSDRGAGFGPDAPGHDTPARPADPGNAGVGTTGFRFAATTAVIKGEFDIEALRACRRRHLQPGLSRTGQLGNGAR